MRKTTWICDDFDGLKSLNEVIGRFEKLPPYFPPSKIILSHRIFCELKKRNEFIDFKSICVSNSCANREAFGFTCCMKLSFNKNEIELHNEYYSVTVFFGFEPPNGIRRKCIFSFPMKILVK